MKYYLYNSLANNGIRPEIGFDTQLVDAVGLDYVEYLRGLQPEDEVVLIGGDGTLNYFINAVKGTEIKNKIYLLGSGTGNDFLTDIGRLPGEEVLINEYLTGLPTVKVNGMEKLFINNMGFGKLPAGGNQLHRNRHQRASVPLQALPRHCHRRRACPRV